MASPDLDEDAIPKADNGYVSISIMLPNGSQMIWGIVKACNHGHNDNFIGYWSENQSLTHVCMMLSSQVVRSLY